MHCVLAIQPENNNINNNNNNNNNAQLQQEEIANKKNAVRYSIY